MSASATLEHVQLEPPPRLFERLRQILGYTWDEVREPLHSSYDNWQVIGTKHTDLPRNHQAPQSPKDLTDRRQQLLSAQQSSSGSQVSDSGNDLTSKSPSEDSGGYGRREVVARISTHILREERAYHICKSLTRSADPDGNYIVRAIDVIRLTGHQGEDPLIVCIFERLGPNYLSKVVDFGPAWYKRPTFRHDEHDSHDSLEEGFEPLEEPMSLQMFLDFAIGATGCLEILHSQQIVHGEIRGDTFHMNLETGNVKMVNFGSGVFTFENSLTTTGWSSLSKELGFQTKLCYLSPEQTGRMPTEPDSRTDIFSLAVLFWAVLTQRTPFKEDTSMDIIQGVLGRALPLVSVVRLDIPDVIGRVIQKATRKIVRERYHSASGLKYDLVEIRKLLGAGDSVALKDFQIATKDISSTFILSTLIVGRSAEHDEVVKVIDRVSKLPLIHEGHGLSPAFNASDSRGTRPELTVITSGRAEANSLANPGTPSVQEDSTSKSSSEAIENLTNLTSLSISRSNTKSRGKVRRCEVVCVAGSPGLGKSRLLLSIQTEARRKGFFVKSKFEQAEKTPFRAILQLISSLFKQVFADSNVDPQFYQALKQSVRSTWHMLYKALDLPEFLLSSMSTSQTSNYPSHSLSHSKGLRNDLWRRQSSSTSSHTSSSIRSINLDPLSPIDPVHVDSSHSSNPLINTILDVLRVFTQHKFICFCLDDLQLADEESLELLSQVLSANMHMVLIVTYPSHESLPEKIGRIIEPLDVEAQPEGNGTLGRFGITRVTLKPLNQEDIVRYVSATLVRPKHEVLPLAAMVESKTGGNPFFMKELLDTCYRKQCIWYDYREGGWRYDLHKIFKQFDSGTSNDNFNNTFVTSRLNVLPMASRSIIAWAALLGPSFSFGLVQKLLSKGYDSDEDKIQQRASSAPFNHSCSPQDAVEGLQAAIQAYIIVATPDDDIFRFAHDRYVQAAASLPECDLPKMHFEIVQTLFEHYPTDERFHDAIVFHICESIDIIRGVAIRQKFRTLLFGYAQSAAENGARSTAAKIYATCISLLQDDPFIEEGIDVDYAETLQLYTRAVECHLYLRQDQEANRLISIILEHAKSPIDKAPAWVLQSRLSAQEGNSSAAFQALSQSLIALDIKLDENPSFSKCDADFKRVSAKLQTMDADSLVNAPVIHDLALTTAIGAVLAETTSAAFWSDTLTLYQMALVMIDSHLASGSFPQSGLGFMCLAAIAISRFNMVSFASDMGNIALGCVDRWRDPYTMGRVGTLYPIYIGHIQYPITQPISQIERALKYSIQAGDRISTVLNFGLVASLKFFTSEPLAELEMLCTYGCEVPNWHLDTPGGTMLITIGQASRALQGKTFSQNPLTVMSDELHDSQAYKSWLVKTMKNSDRPLLLYESIEIAPLFLYGYYARSVELGNYCLKRNNAIWSARNTRFVMFFQGLSLVGSLWQKLQDPTNPLYHTIPPGVHPMANGAPDDNSLLEEVTGVLHLVRFFTRKIEAWQEVTDVNYLAWSKLLTAQTAELEGDFARAMKCTEEALDHAAAHGFLFEEALGNYLQAGFLLRIGSKRLAKAALREAIVLYRKFDAFGIAKHIEDEHSLLLRGGMTRTETAEIGIQTDFVGDSASVEYHSHAEADELQQIQTQIGNTRLRQKGLEDSVTDSGLHGLHMLDLTSILKSSQVISSVLKVEQLLMIMCEIILQNCKGLATLAAIIIEEPGPSANRWSVAASGEPEQGVKAHVPGLLLSETDSVAQNVVLYCTRFQETVFLPDITHDQRFSNVQDAWTDRNPDGKSVIAIPICHGDKPLLGVLYLEGQPHVFTDRNLTVLQLLVNQIGISYSNALTLKKVETISAINNSMVIMQKKALEKALIAEGNANKAEREALQNLALAKEAANAKSIFLANVSHELRTPLNGVIGNSELLIDTPLQKNQFEMADSIRISADVLLTLINDILDFSKMEANKMKLHSVAFYANEMIAEVVRSIKNGHTNKKKLKNVEIVQNIEVPQVLIFGDPGRLHQVLGNLLGNSLKFTEKGSITVGVRAMKDWKSKNTIKLTFWVKDTGIGIPQQQLSKLFKPFSQADASTGRKYGGSGLGLSICKLLIESLMGGTIQLESVENQGTTVSFSLVFPLASAGTTPGDDQSPERFREDTSSPLYTDLLNFPREKLRICIAEDNPINQKIAIQFVEKLGFTHVSAYDNGLDAVEGLRKSAIEGKPYHIILMDVQMPVLDGHEATKLLRIDANEKVREILVIAMTASTIQGDKEKCLISGMNDYLAKPVRLGVLKKKLDQYIQPA